MTIAGQVRRRWMDLGRGRLPRLVAPLACGGLVALGQVPFALVPIAAVGLVAAVLAQLASRGVREALWTGWLCGVGYFAVALSWIVEPFLVDAARHGWMAPFAIVFASGGFALFWAAGFGLAAVVADRPLPRAVALAASLTVAEYLRATILSGFPWALLAYLWTETPLIHAAAVVGSHGLTLLTLLAAAAVAMLIHRPARPLSAVALGLPLIGVAGLGVWQAQAPFVAAADRIEVRVVQPNAAQREKWDPARAEMFVERQIAFTAAPGSPDVVVWPETALPYWLHQSGPVLERIAAAADGAPVLVGVQRLEAGRMFNALAVVSGEGVSAVYDKHHLVPFGEYIPLGGLTRWLGLRSFAAQDGYGFSAGPGPRVLDLGALGEVLPLICYEAIFPQGVAAAPGRPDWLVQVTNDAWFGTVSGPFQHLAQARMRSVEQGLPLVRAANTGVSAVIDARGRVVDSIPLGVSGFIDVVLPPSAPPTPYARTGDLPALAGALLLLVLAAGARFRSRLRGV